MVFKLKKAPFNQEFICAKKNIYISPKITLEAKSSRKGSDMKSVFSHDHVRCVLLDGAAITDNGALSAEFIRVLRG